MPQLRKPTPQRIDRFLRDQAKRSYSYAAVGATTGSPPEGYHLSHNRCFLGSGMPVFRAARVAISRWRQLQLGWVEAYPDSTAIEVGQPICIVAFALGLWWLNACRIVYVVDESEECEGPARFGFAYGTLPAHSGRGEERFLIEIDEEQRVTYDILAFSRPQRLSARLGRSYLRVIQRRFAEDSLAAMRSQLSEPLGR